MHYTKQKLYMQHRARPTLYCAIRAHVSIFLPISYPKTRSSLSFAILALVLIFLQTSYRIDRLHLSFGILALVLNFVLTSYQQAHSSLSCVIIYSFFVRLILYLTPQALPPCFFVPITSTHISCHTCGTKEPLLDISTVKSYT